jgi:Fe-S cluster biogenesis protein NfuA
MSTSATVSVEDAVRRLRPLVQGDGADLRLVRIDDAVGVVEIALELDDAGCSDCMLPPARLRDVLAMRLLDLGMTSHRLVVRDPRAAGGQEHERVMVLDPTATVGSAAPTAPPDVGPLKGKTVCLRVDVLWTSWDVASEQWKSMFEAAGAKVRVFRRTQGLAGDDGDTADRDWDDVLAGADAAVVGLGNCGSCTSWTIKDAVRASHAGVPTAAVVTEHFAALGATLARSYGEPGLRLQVLPFPLQTRPDDEVRGIAVQAFPALLDLLGARA